MITTSGRDQGKVFLLREMPASKAEAWAARFFIVLANSGAEVPENLLEMGMAGVAAMIVRGIGGVTWLLLKPLLDEMFECVKFVPEAHHPERARPLLEAAQVGPNGEEDIEEIRTRLQLREELLTLHTGFSIAATISSLREAARARESAGQNIETSQES